jgi:hypothetical protein
MAPKRSDREIMFDLRNQAIARRDAGIAEANAQFDADRKAEDEAFDLVFDRARDAYEAAKKRLRPTYDLAKRKRDQAVIDVDQVFDTAMRAIYDQHGVGT